MAQPRRGVVGSVGAEGAGAKLSPSAPSLDTAARADSPLGFPATLAWPALPRLSRRAAALFVVLALALAFRVVNLNALGFNSDEAVYAGQAAALAQAPTLEDIFPIFRAHPLLYQFVLALAFAFGPHDWLGRLVSAAVGVAAVGVVYALGSRLYGASTGLVAALLLALMPYHVVVSRQVLLDGPLLLCSSLSLLMLVRFAQSRQPLWLYAAAAAMGLTFLAKETGFILVGAIYAFLALSPEIGVRLKHLALSLVVMLSVMLTFPLSLMLAGGGAKTKQYLVWQLFRRPNHTWDFYATVVPPAVGFLVIAAALFGLWALRRQNTWQERLLVLWILVPVVFFELWPTKGFQYLLPIAPPLALLAGRTLVLWPRTLALRGRTWLSPLLIAGVALSLAWPTWNLLYPQPTATFLAGSGGVPGGREVGDWIREHVPQGATFMTIGPSMANIIKFYGLQQAYGLSVSPNPLHRNPSYEPVLNPDYQIRSGELQYLVWDAYSAERSSFFSDGLLAYAKKYHGRAVHTETVRVRAPDGSLMDKPVIIVYEVHP